MARSRVAVVALLAAVSLGGFGAGRLTRDLHTEAVVIDVLDGDTIRVARGPGEEETVRLLGVDTPETHHPERPVECFGPEASAHTETRLLGRTVRLETDVETRDVYGRLLAYVVVDGRRYNDELLELGFARLLVILPNGAHAREMLTAELAARRAGRGLWGEC
ncbi:MAG: thermonuclease family protein [Actinobacteria bacterium]|nr:thermonuclease family protein [Actinomycetota bacterium]